ncbi:hypothetical protein C922_05225 [Plasmodium inui San Antonio 1]|uniref:Uncharacterized protein n=1 Tax=Plasmodium inui San Antonio 1 TaxID=1237626 RepID=W7A5N7_9APIC|nr:hypothetical protein C922_05225 [Plasmodium inui San Antonio 1]EUD64404.1 hypothetical protein C922_05225 [Plasmodium inui San Antonio 1]
MGHGANPMAILPPQKTAQREKSQKKQRLILAPYKSTRTSHFNGANLNNTQVAIRRVNGRNISSTLNSKTGSIGAYGTEIVGPIQKIITRARLQIETGKSHEEDSHPRDGATRRRIKL